MKEYWRWSEYRRTVRGVDWTKAEIVSGGVDVGAVSSKAALMADDRLFAYSIARTGSSSPDSAKKVTDWALEGTGMKLSDVQCVVGTGYGRVNVPFANRTITEISCHARGANYIWGPMVRTILDMGGQDCKAIRSDRNGKVTAFLMNDRCAAGTGRGVEVIADLMSIPIEEIGPASLNVEKDPEPISTTCVVFAKSAALALLRKGWSKEMVLAAYCSAMANRVAELLRRVGVEKEFVITGGISKNIGIVKRLERIMGIEALPPKNELDPALAGAIGAALFARDFYKKRA
nr:benzoyl-CoA reductase, bzd-type, subunit Q [Candidatus Njordarchaeota archaeon]